MDTHSIYSPGPDISKADIKAKICIYGVELQKREANSVIAYLDGQNGQMTLA